jgi:5-methyltetrahydrofolate--homocysteine methyltransferase
MKFKYIPSDCLLLAKPNAGVPRLNKDGYTIFDLTPQDFASQMMSFTKLGVSLIGGCCGNTPEHISALSEAADSTLVNINIKKSAPLGTILADEQLAIYK